MRVLLKILDVLLRLIGKRKKISGDLGTIPKDNYPMF